MSDCFKYVFIIILVLQVHEFHIQKTYTFFKVGNMATTVVNQVFLDLAETVLWRQ